MGFCARGQSDVDSTTPYREDQFYIGASFMGLVNASIAEKPAGLSSHFQIGFVRDIPINSKGNWALATGLGFQTQRIISPLFHSIAEPLKRVQFYREEGAMPREQSRFGMQSVEVPIVLRWRTSTPSRYQFWRLYGGLKWAWNFNTQLVGLPNTINSQDYFNRFQTETFVSFGYNTWNFYVSYPLADALQPIPIANSGDYFSFKLLKIGLIFYLL